MTLHYFLLALHFECMTCTCTSIAVLLLLIKIEILLAPQTGLPSFHNSGLAARSLLPAPFLTYTETYPVSMALGIALISSEERCIATFSVKANLLREGGAWGTESKNELENQVAPVGGRICIILVAFWHTDISRRDHKHAFFNNDKFQLQYIRLTESTPHLVPVMTRPGSRVSPCASSSPCPALYTCVPIQWILLLPTVTVVSMQTALFSMGLEAEDKHWIFPHWASLAEIIKRGSPLCWDWSMSRKKLQNF